MKEGKNESERKISPTSYSWHNEVPDSPKTAALDNSNTTAVIFGTSGQTNSYHVIDMESGMTSDTPSIRSNQATHSHLVFPTLQGEGTNVVNTPIIDTEAMRIRERAIECTCMIYGTQNVDVATFTNTLEAVYLYLTTGQRISNNL